jgi:glycyl-tRNA synthetase beta chain
VNGATVQTRDLLIELGTEELPPRILPRLEQAFADGLRTALGATGLAFGDIESFATPRRLALRVLAVADVEPEREVVRRGPAVSAAFDSTGAPTPAARGFAASCGVDVAALETIETERGFRLAHRAREPGRSATTLIPAVVGEAIAGLPIERRMRWGAGDVEFVRPVHWVVLLFGDSPLPSDILGLRAGRLTRGHRFHAPGVIELARPADYERRLEEGGYVIPAFEKRRDAIRAMVEGGARAIGGSALIDAELLDEVTSLVEWPQPVTGAFDERFLTLPREVLIATMQGHQRYFPVADSTGALMPRFIAIANLESRNPDAVRAGNERVIRPRLSDAAFFWKQDLARPLADYVPGLESMIYERRLGSLLEKTRRVERLARIVAGQAGFDVDAAARAAHLSRGDLLTGMVGEFPELQGSMGRYYAAAAGEADEVATAIEEMYRPRHAGDALPATGAGTALAIADRLDSLVGIFGIGERPTGEGDPYALRRAALGALRILIDGRLDIDLEALLSRAADNYAGAIDGPRAATEVFEFMLERLRSLYVENGTAADVFDAVVATRPSRPYDFDARIRAVEAFRRLPAAQSLASANKRIGNILRKAPRPPRPGVERDLLTEPAELTLATALAEASEAIEPMIRGGNYEHALARLAELREHVDRFFDEVLVMCDDAAIRDNRLALLAGMHRQFMRIADVSKLQS